MKITFVIQDLFQQGAEYVTALMVRGFIAKGYDVDLIVSKVHTDLEATENIKPFEVPDKTNIIRLKNRRARNNIRELRRYLRHTDSSVVIAMCPNYAIALALSSFLLRNKPNLSYVEHSGGIGKSTSKHPFLSKQWIREKIMKCAYNTFMGVSDGTSRGLEMDLNLNRGIVKTVYNPVIDHNYIEKVGKKPTHPWLIDKNIPTFVAAGAFCEIKDHINLFKAFKIANKHAKARLILYGKGYLENRYKKWIEENNMEICISLPGHSESLPAEIKASDGFIVSSEVESFSIVLVEAMAAGIPVIATNCPYGPSEILEDGKYGTLVPINNPEAMAEAIVNQIKNPKSPAPREAWEKFTIDNIVKNYEKALDLTI